MKHINIQGTVTGRITNADPNIQDVNRAKRHFNVEFLSHDMLAFHAAIALGWEVVYWGDVPVWVDPGNEGRYQCRYDKWNPVENWVQGGPVLERFKVKTYPLLDVENMWGASLGRTDIGLWSKGPTLLIAGIRCIVTVSHYYGKIPEPFL